MNNIHKTLYNLYNKKGFYEKYGIDLIIAIIIIYIFFIFTSYFYILNQLPQIKANWPTEKCNPLYLPFAGLILSNKNKSNLDLISENFSGCVQNILTSIVSDAFKPIYYIMNITNNTFKDMTDNVQNIRAKFNNVRTNIKNTSTNISGRALNITIPILKLFITAKNMISETNGVLVASLYTFFGSFLTLKALIGSIIEIIIDFLLILAGVIASAWALSFITFGASVPEAIAATAFYIAILVILLPLIITMNDLLHTGERNVPGPPACFDKNTQIQLFNKTYKPISDIIIGDILFDGSLVTGTMCMSSYGHSIYNLDNIIVTGLHRIYHPIKGWIKVSEHPNSFIIDDYRENLLYCFNTNTKVIKINNHTFSDWDDLDDTEIAQICKKCPYVPDFINNNDIHKYLDNGFEENTLIEMEIGTPQKIKNIEVNDVLRFGERVLGIIKVDPKEILAINNYSIGNTILTCSTNIQLYHHTLGKINTYQLKGTSTTTTSCLYQLITDKGYYHISDLRVSDYNAGIEKYLDNTEFYSQNIYS